MNFNDLSHIAANLLPRDICSCDGSTRFVSFTVIEQKHGIGPLIGVSVTRVELGVHVLLPLGCA
jgi:hypothetical protein